MGARAPSPTSVAGQNARAPRVGCKGTNYSAETEKFTAKKLKEIYEQPIDETFEGQKHGKTGDYILLGTKTQSSVRFFGVLC